MCCDVSVIKWQKYERYNSLGICIILLGEIISVFHHKMERNINRRNVHSLRASVVLFLSRILYKERSSNLHCARASRGEKLAEIGERDKKRREIEWPKLTPSCRSWWKIFINSRRICGDDGRLASPLSIYTTLALFHQHRTKSTRVWEFSQHLIRKTPTSLD